MFPTIYSEILRLFSYFGFSKKIEKYVNKKAWNCEGFETFLKANFYEMASRFQKKTAPKLPSIPGTKPSLFNFQLLTSIGVPGLDQLLGGGLPLGMVSHKMSLITIFGHKHFR